MGIHSPDVLAANAPDYLYLGCVQFVKDVRAVGRCGLVVCPDIAQQYAI